VAVKDNWQNGEQFTADDANAVAAAVNAAEVAANKGQPGGFASLDENALVPQEQLPITTADWDTLEGKPAVVAAGETEADARAAISAAALDESGRVPLTQVPPGLLVDGVNRVGDTFQFTSGGTNVGDPVSLIVEVLDGGSPSTTAESSIDGGTL